MLGSFEKEREILDSFERERGRYMLDNLEREIDRETLRDDRPLCEKER